MAAANVVSSPTVSVDARLNPKALYALEAALVSVLLLALTLAGFGPWFHEGLALALTLGSMGAAVPAMALAHRAGHELRRDPRQLGGGLAKAAVLLAWGGFLGSGIINNLVLYLLFPLFWPVLVGLIIARFALHSGDTRGEDAFLATFDRSSQHAPCQRCGRPTHLDSGSWRSDRWYCPGCASPPKGVSA